MLRRLAAKLFRRSACPAICNTVRESASARFRPALESLDAREVPAALTWTNLTGNNDFYTAANWVTGTGTVAPFAPVSGDDVTFDGTVSSANCNNLGLLQGGSGSGGGTIGIGGDVGGGGTVPVTPGPITATIGLNSLSLIHGYSGTVSVVAPLWVGTFDLKAASTGAIAQPAVYNNVGNDITVTGTFTWTSGILNKTPSAATINIDGGGTITLPGDSNTLTSGSRLNFANLNPGYGVVETTTITGTGNLLLNGTSDEGMLINADAKVLRFSGTSDVLKQIGTKVISLTANSELEFYGAAHDEFDSRVTNNGGLFKLSQGAKVTLKGGDEFTTPGYTQENNTNSRFHIMNGSVLNTPNGVRIDGGSIYIIMNPALPAEQQAASIEGKMTWTGGDLVFSSPLLYGTTISYGVFFVTGDVTWSGGRYLPGVDGLVNGAANKWVIQGTLTVDATGLVKPRIEPNTQRLPAGQLATGTFNVIEATVKITTINDKVADLPDGWTLTTNPELVRKKWYVTH